MTNPLADNYTILSGANCYAGRASPKTAHVFIESGQSNCLGVGAAVDSPIALGTNIGNIKTWRRNIDGRVEGLYSGTGQWYNLAYETNQYKSFGWFGSVLNFALQLRDNLEDAFNEIYIIKADADGVPIDGWLNGGAESVAMYGGHIDPALATLVADPTIDEIRIHGFYFDQGEDDSNSSGTAISYETKLTTFISDIRTHVGITNLPIIIRQLDSTVPTGAIEALRTSQANVATALSNVELITGPYTYNPDNIHLDGTSQNMVGLQRYNTLISMTNGEIYNG